MNGETVQIALKVISILEDLAIPHHVGGSFASSVHGFPRQTRDLDLVVDLPVSAVPLLVSRLESEFYLDAERMRQAIRRGSSFNLVHLTTGFKVDVFVSTGSEEKLPTANGPTSSALSGPKVTDWTLDISGTGPALWKWRIFWNGPWPPEAGDALSLELFPLPEGNGDVVRKNLRFVSVSFERR